MPRTKTIKKKQTNKTRNFRLSALFAGYTVLLVALLLTAIGAMAFHKNTVASVATPQEIELAKQEISELFADRAVDHCPHPDLPETQDNTNGYVIDYRYVRFNEQADRAIISSCSHVDTLLAKTSSGAWVETTVNLTINNRLNPVWQKACMIEDITVADDTVRPENSSIDAMNLEECKSLKSL